MSQVCANNNTIDAKKALKNEVQNSKKWFHRGPECDEEEEV